MLRVVVVDDEPPARRAMQRLIAEHGGIELAGEAGSVRQAATLIGATRPDAVFLDIEMAGGNGFGLLQRLPAAPRIVVVTAHAAHAVPAFDVAAVDFLLKPVLPSRFAATIRRLMAASPANVAVLPRLHLPTHRGLRIVDASQVAAMQAERDYTQVLLAGEPALLVSRAIGLLEAELPSPPFVRLGRSLIVNLAQVSRVVAISRERTDIELASGSVTLSVGRAVAALLRQNLVARPPEAAQCTGCTANNGTTPAAQGPREAALPAIQPRATAVRRPLPER